MRGFKTLAVIVLSAVTLTGAADGVWTGGSGTWTEPDNWLDLTLPGPGETAAFAGAGGTVTIPDGAPFTLSALLFNTNNADAAWVLTGETNTLVAPAEIAVSNGSAELRFSLAGDAALLKTGAGDLHLISDSLMTGTVTVAAGRLTANSDLALGPVPEAYKPDAIILNGSSFGNYLSALTIHANRGITAGQSGAYLFARQTGALLDVAAPVTGEGPVRIMLQTAPVILSNPANDYAGDTLVGSDGPGYFPSAASATLRLGADEVIPHGAGKGALILNGAEKGVLDLNGHTETVNTLSVSNDLLLVNTSQQAGVLKAGLDNADMAFSGELQAGVTLEKIGTGKLFFGDTKKSQGNIKVTEGTLHFARALTLGSMKLTMAGGTLEMTDTQPGLIELSGKVPSYMINLTVPMAETGVSLTTRMANKNALNYPDNTQYQYVGQWYVPEAGTYSFAKAFDNGAYLAIDGNVLLNNSELTALIVTQNVALAAGWHTLDMRVSQGTSGYGPQYGFASGILFDPSNSAFSNAEEIANARRFEDPGDSSVLRTVPLGSATNTVLARLELAEDATLNRSATSATLVWSGDMVKTPEASGTPVLTVTGGTAPLRVGTQNQPTVFGVDVDDANGVVFQDKAWLLTVPVSSEWSIMTGADIAAGAPGVLGTGPITLTNFSLRIPRADALGAGGEAVTVDGTGRTAWFDATLESGSVLIDDPSYILTVSNSVSLAGAGASAGFAGAGTVVYAGVISGSGALVKTGSGDTVLTEDNTFTGQVQINGGRLLVSDSGQLGDSANTINMAGGSLSVTQGDPMTLDHDISATSGGLDVPASVSLTLTGALSGTIAKQGEGTLTLAGIGANGSLDLAVDQGLAILDKSDETAVRNILRVGTNATVRLDGSGGDLISGNVTMTGGTLDLNGRSETVGRLNSGDISSTVTNSGGSATVLTVGAGDLASVFIGSIADGTGSATVSVIKTGTNSFLLAGAQDTQTATGGFSVESGNLVMGDGVRFIRFTTLETRTPGQPPSISEFQLLRDGLPLPWPPGMTMNASSSAYPSSTNGSWLLTDNNSRSAWQAGDASAWVRVNLPKTMLFNGYRWYTTGMPSAQDPVSWLIEFSRDSVNWFTADARSDQASSITVNRGVKAGDYSFNNIAACPFDAVSPASEIAVAAGATLDAYLLEESFATLTGAGSVRLNEGASLRVADISAFTGTFSGKGSLLLDGGAALKMPHLDALVTIVNDSAAPDAVTIGSNSEPLFAAALADGAAPLGLVKQGGGLIRLVDAGSTYTGDTRIEQGTLAVQPQVYNFRYIRFNPSWTLGNNVPNSGYTLCISEIQLMRNGQVIAYPAGTTASTPYANLPTSGGPEKAINGSTTDRWLSTVIPNPLTIDTQSGVTFDGYRWYTSGVNAADRNRAPTAWLLEGSDDNVNWCTIDSRAGVSIPEFVQGAGQLVDNFGLTRPARCKLPPQHWAATNPAAFYLPGVTARYLRFTVNAARNETTTLDWGSSGFSFTELRLLTNNSPVLYPAGTTVNAPGGSFSGYMYPAAKAVDNDIVATQHNRWYSDVMVNPLTVDMGQQVAFDAYCLYTAYNVPNRDPVSWTLEVGNSTNEWHIVDTRVNQTVPADRGVMAGPWELRLPAGQLATDVIPDLSRTHVAAGAKLVLNYGAIETVGPLSGTGTVELVENAALGLNAFEDAVFEGDVTGSGTLAVSGDGGVQTLRGSELNFSGRIAVNGGALALEGAALTGVTNVALNGAATLTGSASVNNNLTVAFDGGSYLAHLGVSGALTVSGAVSYAVPQNAELPFRQTLFTFATADAPTRAALTAGAEALSVPTGYVANVRLTDTSAVLSISHPGTMISLR